MRNARAKGSEGVCIVSPHTEFYYRFSVATASVTMRASSLLANWSVLSCFNTARPMFLRSGLSSVAMFKAHSARSHQSALIFAPATPSEAGRRTAHQTISAVIPSRVARGVKAATICHHSALAVWTTTSMRLEVSAMFTGPA